MQNEAIGERVLLMNTNRADINNTLIEMEKTAKNAEERSRVLMLRQKNVVLFGEGFGPGIQKGGGLYSSTPQFILFDVKIGDWWLEYEKVSEISKQLNTLMVPSLGRKTLYEIVEYVKSKPLSIVAAVVNGKEKLMEGIVATSTPLLLFRNGKPLKFKLKVKDFD